MIPLFFSTCTEINSVQELEVGGTEDEETQSGLESDEENIEHKYVYS